MRTVAATTSTVMLLAAMAGIASAVVAPMPYRPGYGLGSWINPEVVEGMKKEAFARSAILLTNEMESMSTSLARELRMAVAPTKNPLSNQQNIGGINASNIDESKVSGLRDKAWQAKIEAYDSLFDSLNEQVIALEAATKTGKGANGAFTTFAAGVESPVVWGSSQIGLVDRGFDSISVGSLYLSNADVKEIQSGSTSKSSTEASSTASIMAGFYGKLDMSASLASDTAKALARSYSVHSVESTLILTSFATHKMVKQFKNLVTDPNKLREAWNFYKPDQAIPHPMYATADFASMLMETAMHGDSNLTVDDRISMISEVYQGSAVVGMVHFLKADRTTQSSSQSSASTRVSMKEQLDLRMWMSSISGSVSSANSATEQASKMMSSSVVDIVFDIVCQGYIPPIASEDQKQTVLSIVSNMDPGKMTSTADGAKGQNQRQSDAKAVIDALMTSTHEIEVSNPVMGMKSFMDAFNNYAKAASETPDKIGAPVGLNLKEYSKLDVMIALSEEYFGKGGESSSDSDSGSSSDSGSGSGEQQA